MKLKDIAGLFKDTFRSWGEDNAPRLAAALSYYTIFSVAPLVIIAISIAGLVFGGEAASGQIAGQIRNTVGDQAAQAIQEIVRHAGQRSAGIAGSIIGIVTLLLGAGGVFGQLQDALNTIWGVKPKPGRGVLATLKARFLSFSMVLGVGFLLMVSLVLSTAVAALSRFMGDLMPAATVLGHVLDIVLSLGVFTALFALIYKELPDAKVGWRDVWIGAALTAVLFAAGKLLIGLYLGRSSVGSTYGAAGSLVVLLLWVYYSAQLLFFGAEFTKVYARRFGSKIVPDEDAVAVTAEARAEQGLTGAVPMPEAGPSGAGAAQPSLLRRGPAMPEPPGPAEHRSSLAGLEKEIGKATVFGVIAGVVLGLIRRP